MSEPDMHDSFSSDQAANPVGYTRVNGELQFIGKYNIDIRDAYMFYRTQRYLIDHPGKTQAEASRAARSAWRNKAKASMSNAVPKSQTD